MNENYEIVKKLLDTNDTDTIRTTVENFQMVEMPDKVVEYVTAKLELDDNAVRDVITRILSHNKNKNIPKYLVPYISSDEIAARNLAGEILLSRKSDSVQAMLNYLPDANDDDQKFIIDILGLIGDKSATEEIINVLKVSKDDNTILACIEALGNLKAPEGVDEIISMYDSNELFQPTIIEALGKIGTPECINFINANYYGVDEMSKFPLIESLGEIGNEESFNMLINDLQYLDTAYKWVAIEAIGKLQERLNLDLPADKVLKTSLIETLESSDDQYKKSAIKLVNLFDGEEIIEYVFSIYGKDESIDQELKQYFQKNSVVFFKKIILYIKTVPQNLKLCVELIKELIQFDEGESLHQLSDLELRGFVEEFTVLLSNPDEEVRNLAIELLFYLDAETALLFGDTMLEDQNSWNRLKLLEIIQYGDDPRIIELIKELAKDKDEVVRENAQNILNERGLTNLELKEQ
jgi:HEAT repeat protein